MSKTVEEYVEEVKQGMIDLQEIKNTLYPNVSDIKAKIDKTANAELYNSVEAIFGERNLDDPNKDFITFDMYLHCLEIIRLGGKDKANIVMSGQGIV